MRLKLIWICCFLLNSACAISDGNRKSISPTKSAQKNQGNQDAQSAKFSSSLTAEDFLSQRKKIQNFRSSEKAQLEQSLFTQIQHAYSTNDWESFFKLQKKYNENGFQTHLAQIFYFEGLIAISKQRHAQALALLNKSLEKNPRDPQVLFAKAVLFKKMQLTDFSKSLFAEIRQKFPNSVASERARVELEGVSRVQ